MKTIDGGAILGALKKNKLLLIALAAGLILLVLPIGKTGTKTTEKKTDVPTFSLETEEKRLSSVLSKIEGAGRVSVLLSVSGSGSRQLATSGEETLVISSGSGSGEEVVDTHYVNPQYTGAVIVCDGASSSSVKLEVTRAAAVFTGLGTENIEVTQMQ